MLIASFRLPRGPLDGLVAVLSALPEHLRPILYGQDEGVKDPPCRVSDTAQFNAFLASAKSGFFLYAANAVYSLFVHPDERTMTVYEITPNDALALLHGLAPANPYFAYAAEWEEVEHRNRLKKKLSNGSYETWVGRDWHRYLPGLYWMTLIADELARKHELRVDLLEREALGVERLPSGHTLLRFYTEPSQWKADQAKLDALCADTKGVFSIANVRPLFDAAQTIPATQAAVKDWK